MHEPNSAGAMATCRRCGAHLTEDLCNACGTPQRLRHRALWRHALLIVVTLGLYTMIWLWRRAPGLNTLRGNDQVPGWQPVVAGGFWIVAIVLMPEDSAAPLELTGWIGKIAQYAAGVMALVLVFRVRSLLQTHLRQTGQPDSDLSWAWTFLLSTLYLQHVINTRVLEPTHDVRLNR
jgi:hypothetical protein